jgi:hypothetical protein
MPMDFPDLPSLKMAAKIHKFRDIEDGEPTMNYRYALADHVRPIDHIESFEIRFGVGWDKWSEDQKRQSLFG